MELEKDTLPEIKPEELPEIEGEQVEEEELEAAEEVVEVQEPGSDPDADEDGEEEALEIVEFEGETYEVTPKIKAALMRHKDYTQKSQRNAELLQTLEAEREALAQQAKHEKEDFEIQSRLFGVEDQLKQYEDVNWERLENDDPELAQRHFRNYQQLRDKKQDLTGLVEKRQRERSEKQQLEEAKRFQEAEAWGKEKIKNWSSDYVAELAQYASDLGYTDSQFRSNLSPAFLKMLNDGFTGKQIGAKAKQAAQKVTKAKPLRTINAKSGGTQTNRVNLSDASMEDYVKARKRGVGG